MDDLKELLKNIGVEKQDAEPRKCPQCGERDCGGPCYGYEYPTRDGPDFDCSTSVVQDCENCFYIWCDECKTIFVKELLPAYKLVKK